MTILIFFLTILAGAFSTSVANSYLCGYASRHKVFGGHLTGEPDQMWDVLMMIFGALFGAFCGGLGMFIQQRWLQWAMVPAAAVAVPIVVGLIVFGGYYMCKLLLALHMRLCRWARQIGGKKRGGGDSLK